MAQSSIVRMTKARWYLATNELFDGEKGTPYIDWSTLLSEAHGGSKHQRSYLIQSVKGFMNALIESPGDRRTREQREFFAHGTVLNWYWEVRHLVNWMTARGVWRFSSLSAEDLYSFIEERKQRRDGRGLVSAHTRFFRMHVLRQMWRLRKRYSASLKVNPLTVEIPVKMERFRSSWRAIDEPAALALIRDAIQWVDATGPFLIEAMDNIWDESLVVGLTKSQKSVARSQLYKRLEQTEEISRLRLVLGMQSESTYRVLRAALTYTYGACVTIILFLVGLRLSELCRLDHDCLSPPTNAENGDMLRLYGIAAKQGGRQRHWIASSEIEKAVKQILGLTRNVRQVTGRKPLWLTHQSGSFFRSGFKVQRPDAGVLTGYLKKFCCASFRSEAPTIQRIHPHAARKTFARFVVLRNKAALGPLARHFGHICSSITDGSYVGSDIELQKMLSEEGRTDLARNLMDLLNAPLVAGKAAETITKVRSQTPAFKGYKGLSRLVDKLIDEGVQLAPCDWGYCIYSQALSACRGNDRGPNEVHRSPDVCSTCANFAATDQHRPWWEARLRREDEFLKRPGLTEQTMAWASRRRANSARIVAGLLPRSRRSDVSGA